METIKKVAKRNKDIQKILKDNNIEFNIRLNSTHQKELKEHLYTTYLYSAKLASAMNLSCYDKKVLSKVAILHDIGKLVIPEKILYKTTRLTDEEKIQIGQHDKIGKLLLKGRMLNPKILRIIENHHSNKTINPITGKEEYEKSDNDDILCEIIKVADIYSALRMNRYYRKNLEKRKHLK